MHDFNHQSIYISKAIIKKNDNDIAIATVLLNIRNKIPFFMFFSSFFIFLKKSDLRNVCWCKFLILCFR